MSQKLTFLYDGLCPLCLREVKFLSNQDKLKFINFIDISDAKYDPTKFQNISYVKAMKNLHGILENGEILIGLDVLAYAYKLIGFGWVYYPLKVNFVSKILRLIYKFWAKNRLLITRRKDVQYPCDTHCESIQKL